MDRKTNYFYFKKEVIAKFNAVGIDEISDFDWICCEVTGKKRSELGFIKEFTEEEFAKISDAIEKRLKHIPLGYIFGKTNFYGYDFIVNKNVLIPRIDTEILIENVLKEIKSRTNQVKVLDIGTGSGAIAITLNKETGAKTTAVDISLDALNVAKRNALLNNADVEFIQSDLFAQIPNFKFDIIVSNPPYIETSVIETLEDEVKLNEPILALDGGTDGLMFYRKIIDEAPSYLNSKGKLIFEIGYNQGEAVSKLMNKRFKNIQVIKDYFGNDRVVIGEIYD